MRIMRTSVYVLRTHKWDADIRRLHEQLVRDLGRAAVYVLYDTTHGAWDQAAAPEGVTATRLEGVTATRLEGREAAPLATALLVDDAECVRVNPMHNKGFGHTAAWTFWHPETSAVLMHDFLDARGVAFDRIWFVEYDVRCHGDFAVPLSACDRIEADFMAKGRDKGTELRVGGRDSWCWWDSITGDLSALPLQRRLGVFFPATRFSRAMIEALRGQFGRSTGFCEVYVPTVCLFERLRLETIPAHVLATFVYQPNMSCADYNRFAESSPPTDLLHHPVKG
jgi:hypothetical protein